MCSNGSDYHAIAIVWMVGAARAQDMRQVVQAASFGIQTGNLSIFSPGPAQRITAALGGSPTGMQVYQNLAALGPANSVTIFGQYPMPNGVVVQARSFHPAGFLDWTLGFSYVTQRIEFGRFNGMSNGMPIIPGGPPPNYGPVPNQSGPQRAPDNHPTTTPPVPKSDDEACTAYPTLCN